MSSDFRFEEKNFFHFSLFFKILSMFNLINYFFLTQCKMRCCYKLLHTMYILRTAVFFNISFTSFYLLDNPKSSVASSYSFWSACFLLVHVFPIYELKKLLRFKLPIMLNYLSAFLKVKISHIWG